jgi:hypothetical protein
MNTSDTHWILEFTFDPLAASVRIVFTANPDAGTKDREIVVNQIVALHAERYHDADRPCLGDFSGVSVTRHGKYWRYALDSGDATVTFDSLEKIEL